MSLSRARKKFLGSLSRKKKLKISEQKDSNPASFLRSLSPLPGKVTQGLSNEELTGHLQSSTSLPDQLDQSETLSVSKVSSKSLSYIDALHSSPELSPLVGDSLSKSNSFHSHNSVGYFRYIQPRTSGEMGDVLDNNSVKYSSSDLRRRSDTSTCDTGSIRECSDDVFMENPPDTQSTSSGALHSALKVVTLLSYASNSETSNLDQKSEIQRPQGSISSMESPIENQRQCCLNPTSLQTSNTSVSSDRNADHDMSSINQSMPSERSDTSEGVSQFWDSSSSFSTTGTSLSGSGVTLPSRNFQSVPKGKDCTNEKTLLWQATQSQKASRVNNKDSQLTECAVENSKKTDSLIGKKIKFFETYNKNVKKRLGDHNDEAGSSSNIKKNARSASTRQEDTKMSSSQHFRSMSVCETANYEDGTPNCGKTVHHIQPGTNSRLFNRSGVLRQRLNFSRFKRSDSIPEVVALCSCEVGCDDVGSCEGSVGEIMRSDLNDPGDYIADTDMHERITLDRVCHHPQCTESNNDMPLMLCPRCDLNLHNNPRGSGHLVLDAKEVNDQYDPTVNKHTEEQATVPQTPHVCNGEAHGGIQTSEMGDLSRSLHKQKDPLKKLIRSVTRESSFNSHNAPSRTKHFQENQRTESPTFNQMESVSRDLAMSRKPSTCASIASEDSLVFPSFTKDASGSDTESVVSAGFGNSRNRKQLGGGIGNFTLRFPTSSNNPEDLVIVAATPNGRLWETVSPFLEGRKLDISSVNVFLEKSQTPLPMDSCTSFLVDEILEVKEKDTKDLDPTGIGMPPLISRKVSKSRHSRRDSAGLVSLLLEAPPTKQRRGSLQLPFREHFFAKVDAKTVNEMPKASEDGIVSLAGRKPRHSAADDDNGQNSGSERSSTTSMKGSKPAKPPRLNSSNKEKERQDQLNKILNQYNPYDLPYSQKFDESVFDMETSWKIIVGNRENMTKKQLEHQEAVWELLKTEVSYIKQIRVIIDVFQNSLIYAQQESFLTEIESEQLFSNIDKVYECNCLFWKQHLLPVLQHSRDTRQPLNPLLSKGGFVDHFTVLFQVYFKYLIEQKSCLDYAKTCMDNSELFKAFIQWAESQKECNRLRFADMLVQPMSRLLKYSLLLRAILKYTEDEREKEDLQAMIQPVNRLCRAANNRVRRREEYERLAEVANTIESFDFLDTPKDDESARIIQEYSGNFNLLAPMPGFVDGPRSLVFQSTLKMKEWQSNKLDIDCLLFTDLLLICKSNKKRLKIIRPPMRLNQLVVSELKDRGSFLLIYVNEYSVPLSAFTFHSDPGAITGWLDKFRQTQKEFKEKEIQKSFSKDRLRSDTSSTLDDLDLSLTSIPSYLDASNQIPRSDSIDSIDRFPPNRLAASDAASDSNQSDLVRSSSLGNFQNHSSGSSTQTTSPLAYGDMKLTLPSSVDYSIYNDHVIVDNTAQGNSQNAHTLERKPLSHADFKNTSAITFTSADSTLQNVISPDDSPGLHDSTDENIHELISSSPNYEFKKPGISQSQKILCKQNSFNDDKDQSKTCRRTDKRYRTADEIPEISKKESSIHKWSSLRMDAETIDAKTLDSSILSTESLQSFPSSSGIGSSGSLHFTMEMYDENNDNNNDNLVFSDSSPVIVDHRKHFSVDDGADVAGMLDVVDGDNGKLRLNDSKHSKSKSTSDLVEIFNNSLRVSQVTDGIASVDMATNVFRGKLTQMDIVRLKKIRHQILCDANTESSDV